MHEAEFLTVGDGEPGGKARGLMLMKAALSEAVRTHDGCPYTDTITCPTTAIVTTSVFSDFIEYNKLESIVESAKESPANFDSVKETFVAGEFSESARQELARVLGAFRLPLVVRSSSLLEDQKGASFAGKYESVFFGNQGTDEQRMDGFLRAIKEVYASTFNPNAIAYRKKHGFMDEREEMALVIQGVVGRRYEGYYLPAMAGVAFSQNGYSWNKEISRKDGLVRLVFGLGTRAVGRGYVRLFSPAKPGMRPEGTEVNNIQKCSQKKVDVIDLDTGVLKGVHFRELMSTGFKCYPGAQAMVSLRDSNYLYRPVSNLWDTSHIPVLTMDGVLSGTWMGMDVSQTLGWLLKTLERSLGYSVDVEFAINVDEDTDTARLYVLQVRPLSEGDYAKAPPIPKVADEDVICTVQKNLPTAYVPDIEYIVYVDEMVYHEWPLDDRQGVARVVGKINESLKGKRFVLVGPGRWGSWNPQLGVPVSYAEISNCVMLAEVARRQATYVPEVSFGSHFFQDLIEDRIAYLPIHPDEPNEFFNERIFKQRSTFSELLADDYYRKYDSLIKVIHIPAVSDNRKAVAILDGEHERAAVFIQ